ncbi:MAG: polysaccharide deacetylase [Roseburia sp.]|nr:polysaccharide deacetylase [Roseburia sp.]
MKQTRVNFILVLLVPGLLITGCSFSPTALSYKANAVETKEAASTEIPTESETRTVIYTETDLSIVLPADAETKNAAFPKEDTEDFLPTEEATESEFTEEESAAARRTEKLVPLLEEASQLALGYYYDEAIDCLSNAPTEFARDEELLMQIAQYTQAKDSYLPYEQTVRHVFFHSLIADTSLAFDGDYMENGYNYWMTTVDEFRAMLEELYANQYILIDIHDLCREETDESGNTVLVANQPLVPEGKKPLVLSVDDVNYYEYMEHDGFARKLILDENGDVKNLYIDENGQEFIGDYDVVPILDAFVKEHPDFSLRGAKGIIALTGYEGTLGYDTHLSNSPTLETDKADAKAVADRMKETGWLFAVHGYGHRHTAQISYDLLVSDTSKWKAEVGSLVGETDIYIYPYGEEIDYPSDKLSYLQGEGFRYFCGVWTKAFVSVSDTYVRQSRCNLDGHTMIRRPEDIVDLFDASKVLDTSRPELQ